MKKFNWKLLLVVALALVLVISLFACNPKTDDNNNNEPEPEPDVQTTDVDDFFDELYAVGGGIGQEEIATGKNVYLEAELGLALGTRVRGKEAANPVELGIALKALLDRSEEGKDTAFALDLTVGNAQAISLYYKLSDENVYLALGGQKVKINTKLIGLDQILGGLLKNGKIGEKTLPEYVSELAAKTGEDFTFDTFGAFLLQTFGLQSMIDGNATISGVLAPYKDGGVLSLQRLLEADLVRGAFTATKADLGTATRYTASLGHAGEIDGALLNTGLIGGFLGAGDGVGDLDVKVSFDADSNHKLQDGVKVSLDLIVDQANELYASLPGAGSSKEYPFVQINIKHLNLQDGTGERVLPIDTYNYRSDLELNIKEHFEFPGILVAGACLPKVDLNIQAKIDLQNEGTANTTQLGASLQTIAVTEGYNADYTGQEYKYADPVSAIELTYAKGRLAFVINKDVSLIGGMAAEMTVIYSFMSTPLGNLIQGVLEKVDPAQAEAFESLYWSEKPVKDEKGTITKDGTWNKNFKYFVVDNMQVSDLIGYLMGTDNTEDAATTSEDAQPETPETPAQTAKEKNMYNGIVKIFTLLGMEGNKLTVQSRGLLPLICDMASYFGAPLTPDSALQAVYDFIVDSPFSIVETALSFKGGKGGNFIERLNWFLMRDDVKNAMGEYDYPTDNYTPEENNLKLDVLFSETGVNWELSYYSQYDAGEDPAAFGNVGLLYTSQIGFDTPVEIKPFDLKDYNSAKSDYETKLEAAKTKAAEEKTKLDAADATLKTKTDAYQATTEYKNYDAALTEYNDAKDAINPNKAGNLWNELKLADGTPYGTYFTPTLGVVNGTTANGLWRIGSTVANNKNYGTKTKWTSPLLTWVEAGEKADGTEREALNTIIGNIQKLIEDNANLSTEVKTRYKNAIAVGGELFNALLRECKAAIDYAAKDTANKATSQYSEYTAADSAQKTAKSNYDTAYQAVADIENHYLSYYYWDLKTNPPTKPEPAPAE